MSESINIYVRTRGTRVVVRDINNIGRASRRTGDSVGFLKKSLGGLSGFFAGRELVRAIDQYNALNNRLSVVSGSIDQVESSYNELLQIANRTLVPLNESVVLFQRASIAADQLGASNQDLFKFVETVGQALAIQGGNAQTARGALIQLSQAIGTDIVRAEEFNSILEGAFPIALAAAKGIDGAAGSISRLRKMVINGEVESREFFDAIMSQSDELEAQFQKITPTMAQGFNVLNNGWVTYVGRLDEALGASHLIGQTMIWMGENMEIVGAVAMATGAALIVAFGPTVLGHVNRLRKGVLGLNAAMLANPVVALAAAVVGLTTYFLVMRNQIMLGTDDLQTLGDLVSVFVDDIKALGAAVFTALSDLFGPAIKSAGEFVDKYDLTVVGILRATADAIDTWIGIYVGAFHAVKAVWDELPTVLVDSLKRALQPAADLFQDFINEMIEASNTLRSAVGMDPIELVNFDLDAGDSDFTGLGEKVGAAFMEGFTSQSAVRDYLEGAIERSRGKTLRRQYEELMRRDTGEARTPPDLPPLDDGDSDKEADKLANALRQLIDRYDGVAAAKLELAEAEGVLQRAVENGLIGQTRRADLLDRMKHDLQESIDPLGHMVSEMAQEAELLRMSSRERDMANSMLEAERDLREDGVILSKEQNEELRRELESMRQLRELTSARDGILEELNGAQREYNIQLTALNGLLADGTITLDQYNKVFKDLKETVPEASNVLDQFAENAARGIHDTLADFLFDPFEDGLSGMLDSFTVMIRRMVAEAVAADLTRRLFGAAGGGSGDGWLGTALSAASAFIPGGGAPVQGGFMTEVAGSFHGGGYTGDSPRSGGLDGRGGFLAIMHPQETVTDHTQEDPYSHDGVTQNINNTFVIQERKDNRTQSQVSMAASQAQRRASARFGA